jgi:hypothetical protein
MFFLLFHSFILMLTNQIQKFVDDGRKAHLWVRSFLRRCSKLVIHQNTPATGVFSLWRPFLHTPCVSCSASIICFYHWPLKWPCPFQDFNLLRVQPPAMTIEQGDVGDGCASPILQHGMFSFGITMILSSLTTYRLLECFATSDGCLHYHLHPRKWTCVVRFRGWVLLASTTATHRPWKRAMYARLRR